MAQILIRSSRATDLPAIRAIYAREVLDGLASFEEVPPDEAEMAGRRAAVLTHGLPHLVADAAGKVAGFAYAAPYRARPAYRFTVENSVYVDRGARGQGVARALLEALISGCAAAGRRQMIAVIGDSGNAGSIALHRSLRFREVGVLHSVGFKHGRWVDSVLMQRGLGDGDATLPVAPGQV